jgi:hypothetical protein
MLGVKGPAPDGVTLTGNLAVDLGTYSDRSLAEEAARYGNISVSADVATGKISVGFLGPWNLSERVRAAEGTMMTILNAQAGDYGILVAGNPPSTSVFIRVR